MSKISCSGSEKPLERFLEHVSPDVANSLTTQQLQGLAAALSATQWRRHPVDIRLTVPLLWKRYYLVFLAGPERRDQERLREMRRENPLWRPANISLMLGLVSLGMLGAVGLFHLGTMSLSSPSSNRVHPAGIPFKESPEACEESGRVWKEGECIDFAHDPTF